MPLAQPTSVPPDGVLTPPPAAKIISSLLPTDARVSLPRAVADRPRSGDTS